jgi:hypothetical protein
VDEKRFARHARVRPKLHSRVKQHAA